MHLTIREMLADRPALPRWVAQEVRRYGVVVGSKVFGGFDSKQSDVDILLPLEFTRRYDLDDLMMHGAVYAPGTSAREQDSAGEEFLNVYANMPDSKYIHNLLLMSNVDLFQTWSQATENMKLIMRACPDLQEICSKHKRARIALFEHLKYLFDSGNWEVFFKNTPLTPAEFSNTILSDDDDIPF